MRLGDLAEGTRVRLTDEAIEEECNGVIAELVVTEVRVRFDDGEVITFDADDRDFEEAA